MIAQLATLMWIVIAGLLLLGGLLCWQALTATLRLCLALHTPGMIALLLERLAAATAARRPWEPELRALRPLLPWPWPWRLQRAAGQLAAGMAPADMLATGRLLPAPLRIQAAHALRQGPEVFQVWCAGLAGLQPVHPLLARQLAFILAEFSVVLLVAHFLIASVFPKWRAITLDLHMAGTPLLDVMDALRAWEGPLLLGAGGLVLLLTALLADQAWRAARRRQAARLLLAGSATRLPEAALGGSTGGGTSGSGDFAQLAAAAGLAATTPAELARAIQRDDFRRRRRAAWLPAVSPALLPLLLAIPVGVLVVGVMRMLLQILAQAEIS